MKFSVCKTLFSVISVHLIFSTAVPTVFNENEQLGKENSHHHRIIRSPQLFPGRNVLSDLSQIRPPSLNDLNEFRQKMASLANLTTLLEHAITAEKVARNTLESFVNTIKDQITGVQRAVNPDSENYWAETKKCGGVLVSQTGRISYKLNEYYENYERCTWTIRANHRSKIKLTLTEGDLEEDQDEKSSVKFPLDYVSVTEFPQVFPQMSSENGSNRIYWNSRRVLQGQTILCEGPVIFITFYSDGSIRKKGFQLTFEGIGSTVNPRTVYQHFHFKHWSGQFDHNNMSQSLEANNIKSQDGTELMTTILINPQNWNASKLRIDVSEETLDLRPSECEKTSLDILSDFSGLPYGGLERQSSKVINRCCSESCESKQIESEDGIMLAIFRSSDLTGGSYFMFDWTTDTSDRHVESVDTCGGILTGNFGKISYKKNSAYGNNERCVWIIMPEVIKDFTGIKVQLVTDGFELRYDYVTLSYFDFEDGDANLKTKFLYESGKPVRVSSPLALVQFYSDTATFGKTTGFELIWEVRYTSASSMNMNVEYVSDESSGERELTCCKDNESRNECIPQFILIKSPTFMDNSILTAVASESVAPSQFALFESERGNFSRILGSNNTYASKDGILAILRNCCEGGKNEMSINWRTDKTTFDEDANGMDDRTIVKSEDKCGDLLHGDAGQIVYKIGKEYEVDERCTWIIRAKARSTITVQLMADGFESCCDGLSIYKISMADGIIDPEGVSISRENRFQTLDAEALLVTFFSDHSVKGTGFVLEYQTKGRPLASNEINLQHSHIYLDARPTPEQLFESNIQLTDNLVSVDTFAFQNVLIARANITATLKMENLKVNECNQDSVALYHMQEIGKYQLQKIYPSQNREICLVEGLAGQNPVTQFFNSGNGKLHPQNGVLVIVTKIKSVQPDATLSVVFE